MCDLCGESVCLMCGLGTPMELPYKYCRDCGGKLDGTDPTMNLELL